MNPKQQYAFQQAMGQARTACKAQRWVEAMAWLERAHVIGQRSTRAHVLSHYWMLKVGWWRRDWREVCGQLVRLPAALLLSRLWVPVGNTGGANVSAFKPMPIPAELADVMEDA